MTTPRTPLARKHAAVIASAPVEARPQLRKLAAACCLRRYDALELGGSDDCLAYYLDSEDFYYGNFTA